MSGTARESVCELESARERERERERESIRVSARLLGNMVEEREIEDECGKERKERERV